MKHSKAGLGLRLIPADHIGVGHGTCGDKLALTQGFNGPQAIPVLGGVFKIQPLRGLLHLAAQRLTQRLLFALQKLLCLLHTPPVLHLWHLRPAEAVALLHMVIQAGPLFSDVTGKFFITAWQAKDRLDGLNDLLGTAAAAIGPEIGGAVILDAVGKGDLRIGLPQVQPQIGIALVILQKDVVFGHIVLDKRTFQHQSLKFRGGADGLKMVYQRDHTAGLCRMRGRVLEILADAVLQFFGLAHIDHRIRSILHQIDAGLRRQRIGGLFQFISRHKPLRRQSCPKRVGAWDSHVIRV